MRQKEKEASFKEVTLLEKMKHPNIVTFVDSFEGNNFSYVYKIMMEIDRVNAQFFFPTEEKNEKTE